MLLIPRIEILRFGLLLSLLVTVATSAAPVFASETSIQANALADMDLSIDPGADFYRYANGGWLDSAAIPADFPAWDTMTMLDGQTRLQLVELLNNAAEDQFWISPAAPGRRCDCISRA